MTIDFSQLNEKKFQFTNAEMIDGHIALTLQYGNQVGQIMIGTNFQYAPQDLYKFPELLDQLLSEVAPQMYEQEYRQEQETAELILQYLPKNRLEGEI